MTNDDVAPIDFGEGAGNIQNPLDRRGEYSVSQDDYPNAFGTSFTYELPFGPNKRFLNKGGLVGGLVGGWQVAGFVQRQSGAPLSVKGNTSLSQFGFSVVRANYMPGQNVYLANSGSFDPATNRYLNADAFSNPGAFQFGNTSRVLNWVRGPRIDSESLSLQKQIVITEQVKAVLRADATNPFNFVRWTNPNTSITDANYGRISNSQSDRVIQLSASVTF
jgi:hypothetical protein